MARLILVKHAHPEVIPGIAPRDWLLSESGRQTCLMLAAQLQAYSPSRIITSHEPKASETGRIAAAQLKLPVSEADDLHEHDRSREPFEDDRSFKAKVRAFFAQPDLLIYGAETAAAAHQRFVKAVEQVQRQYPDDRLVIVAHGTVISLYLARLLHLEPYTLWASLRLPSFVVLEDGHPVARWNVTPEES